jgi:predicted double-glycine peptidase
LLIVNDDDLTARIVDYKTGNDKYPDRDQLTLMSLMVFEHFPHIRQVDSALLFVVKETMVKHRMSREDVESGWWQYRLRVSKLYASFSNNVWHPNQTPLCGWCPVRSCEFNPKH